MPRRSPALILVHVVWATARRRPILGASFDATLAAILGRKASNLDSAVLATGCGTEHVHVLLRLAPTMALADVVQRLKGATAYDVNQRHLMAEKLEWQAGYWAESIAHADFEPLARYVRSQREHHDDSHPAERWQFDTEGGARPKGGLFETES